jgi:aspartate/tyrosine/aromatic aminotransferase
MTFFDNIPLLPPDPIFGLRAAFTQDPRPHKIDLGIGAYQTEEGLPCVLNCVRKAEALLLERQLDKEYLPIDGDQDFLRCAIHLLLGKNSPVFERNNAYTAQTVGGASALRIAGEFLAKLLCSTIFLPVPTWSNHQQIFERAGLKVDSYPYFNQKTCMLDFEGMCEAVHQMPSSSAILLHGCCHNPTGVDPTLDQWKELSKLIKKKKLIPVFDIAYQGFGKSLDDDAEPIRYFASQNHEMFIAYSFSKNFGLYGERVGFLTALCSNSEQLPAISSQVKSMIRGNFSNPPLHGARIVSTILNSPELISEWVEELTLMRERIVQMRETLITALDKNSERLSYMSQQKGLFSYTGLSKEQVLRLQTKYAIYMPTSGRINIAGLNSQNLPTITEALNSVIEDDSCIEKRSLEPI